MTKKIIVIAVAFVLCLAVIGGCFALYTQGDSLKIHFGTEDAVALTIGGYGSALFEGVTLSPEKTSATQKIVLDVSYEDKGALVGMNGQLKVALNGGLKDYVELSATADTDAGSYDAAALTAGVILPLNNLPKNFTLKLALKGVYANAEGYFEASGKSVEIKVTWEVAEWAPIEGGYYIVGDFCEWGINQGAIYMGNKDNENKAFIDGVTLTAGQEFKVKQYKSKYEDGDNDGWQVVQVENGKCKVGEGIIVKSEGRGDTNLSVPTTGQYYICVNNSGFVWINKK